jgi:hypothetical protein
MSHNKIYGKVIELFADSISETSGVRNIIASDLTLQLASLTVNASEVFFDTGNTFTVVATNGIELGSVTKFPVSPQPLSTPLTFTTTDEAELTLTNAPGSARTDVGFAGAVRMTKINEQVLYKFRWGNLRTAAPAVANAPLSFNENIPARFLPNVQSVRTLVGIVNNALPNGGEIMIETNGVITVHPDLTLGSFTLAADCAVLDNSVTWGLTTNI